MGYSTARELLERFVRDPKCVFDCQEEENIYDGDIDGWIILCGILTECATWLLARFASITYTCNGLSLLGTSQTQAGRHSGCSPLSG